MTVSQSQHEILWEPLSAREVAEDTLGSFQVDGLDLDEFGLSEMQRIADEEIDHDEAVALALQHYRR
jgi:hypothetical protein